MSRTRTRGLAGDGRISLSLAVLIGSTAFLIGLVAGDALSQDQKVRASLGAAATASAVPELPPEWAWERDAVTFDHMFRKK
ncbi:MAG: hypothetical protein V3V67_18230 [Myxococcota bacterium]